MSGGVSEMDIINDDMGAFSPHKWGCFQMGVFARELGEIFPTQVGVFLRQSPHPKKSNYSPHISGGCFRAQFSMVQTLHILPT